MAYSNVSRIRNGAAALAYLQSDHGHNGHEKRNAYVSAINLFGGTPYLTQFQRYWNRARVNHVTQFISVIIAFSKKEFDPSNPADIHKAHMVGREFVKNYPDRQALICTQIDGAGGYIHLHILISDVAMTDYKGCDKNQYHFVQIKKWTNEITSRYTELDSGNNSSPDKRSQAELAKLEDGKYSYKDDMRQRIKAAMALSDCENEFYRRLTLFGIEAVKKSSKEKGAYFTYELCDTSKAPEGVKLPNHALKARSYKLGADYGPEALQQQIEVYNSAINILDKKTSDEYEPMVGMINQEDYVEPINTASNINLSGIGAIDITDVQQYTSVNNKAVEKHLHEKQADGYSAKEQLDVVNPLEKTPPAPRKMSSVKKPKTSPAPHISEKPRSINTNRFDPSYMLLPTFDLEDIEDEEEF